MKFWILFWILIYAIISILSPTAKSILLNIVESVTNEPRNTPKANFSPLTYVKEELHLWKYQQIGVEIKGAKRSKYDDVYMEVETYRSAFPWTPQSGSCLVCKILNIIMCIKTSAREFVLMFMQVILKIKVCVLTQAISLNRYTLTSKFVRN